MADDRFFGWPAQFDAPFSSQKAVEADDNNDLPNGACRALEVISEGDVVCIAVNDTASVTRTAVPAGTIIPGRIRRVLETTTATVLALY